MNGKDLQLFAGILIALALCVLAPYAFAQTQCICTNGCKIVANPYVPVTDMPTSCNVYQAGVKVASAPMVSSASIPLSNATVCTPASSTYVPGTTGSMACSVPIPPQASGSTVTVTMRASNGSWETGDSAALTFKSVGALPPVGLRVTQ